MKANLLVKVNQQMCPQPSILLKSNKMNKTQCAIKTIQQKNSKNIEEGFRNIDIP